MMILSPAPAQTNSARADWPGAPDATLKVEIVVEQIKARGIAHPESPRTYVWGLPRLHRDNLHQVSPSMTAFPNSQIQ